MQLIVSLHELPPPQTIEVRSAKHYPYAYEGQESHISVTQQSGSSVATNVIRSYGACNSVGITVMTLAEKGTRRL